MGEWLYGSTFFLTWVYTRKPQDIDMLKTTIEEEIRAIPVFIYQKAMRDFESVADYAVMWTASSLRPLSDSVLYC
jgi:hypothetical protein